jgi:hypothetical protein
VVVDSYNVETKDEDGFLGDRASTGAYREILEKWRKPVRKAGEDPFGDESSEAISKKKLDTLLAEGNPDAAGVLQGAIEDFAQELALVIRRFLKLKAWRDTERIVVGGGFRASRVGELAIARAGVILKADEGHSPRSGRSRPDRRRPPGAVMAVQGARWDPGGGYRRHEFPRRRGAPQPEEITGAGESLGRRVRAVAPRR